MVPDDNGKEPARNQCGIEAGIACIEVQQRRPGKFRRCCDHHNVVGANSIYDRGAELLIAATEHETLRTDRTEHELAGRVARQ